MKTRPASGAPVAIPSVLDPGWHRLQRIASQFDEIDEADYTRAVSMAREGYGYIDADGLVHVPEGGVQGSGRVVRPASPHVIMDDGSITTRRLLAERQAISPQVP